MLRTPKRPQPKPMEDTVAQATPGYSRFHNLSNEALADAIGQADAVLKGAEAEVKALKTI